jgi:HD-like signal output (HDOD) protein
MSDGRSLSEQVRDYLGKAGLQLQVFNPVALELQRALTDEDSAPASIEALIAKDPALAGQVLRMANSSAFTGLAQVSTLKQALRRLGFKQVGRLAIAASQMSLYRPSGVLAGERIGGLWRQAYACAFGGGWLAEKTGRAELAEAAFLAGLLHDIGKLLILQALEDIVRHEPAHRDSVHAVLDEMLESLHADFGFELMKRWNLPEAYCTVVRDHHLEGSGCAGDLMLIVQVLDQVCAKMGIGCDPDPDMVPAASAEARALGASELLLAELEVALEDGVALV